MKSHMRYIIFLLLLGHYSHGNWWEKPKVLSRVKDQRQILVVIKSHDKPANHFEMTGTGALRVPKEFAIKQIMNFKDLEKVSPHFKKVIHQPELSRVYFVLEAYGYQARMLIKYTVKSQGDKSIFHWNVVWGGFQGMIGDIEFSSLNSEKSLAVLKSTFDAKEIPLPKIFKTFLLEIIVQRVASKMRAYIEEQHKQKAKK